MLVVLSLSANRETALSGNDRDRDALSVFDEWLMTRMGPGFKDTGGRYEITDFTGDRRRAPVTLLKNQIRARSSDG
ncbi:MAG: hypothetical protein LBV27_10155 [Oscillospiraceae bacterium]|nr:hypothetical protein [Oscillospiraceae bacterium]